MGKTSASVNLTIFCNFWNFLKKSISQIRNRKPSNNVLKNANILQKLEFFFLIYDIFNIH